MHGRREILTSEAEITDENVAGILSNAYIKHLINRGEIEFLYNYYKGQQPILTRIKEVRPELCNRIVENRANAIVTFRVGYTVGKPIQYISSVSEESVSSAIAQLNDMMRIGGKATKDKQLVEWQMICGTAYRMILPKAKPGRVPFDFWTADPRNTFIIYMNDIGHTPLAGVYYTISDNQDVTFHLYTDTRYSRIDGWQSAKIVEVSENGLGRIPIIEYPLNMARLGAFEIVLPLLDSINEYSVHFKQLGLDAEDMFNMFSNEFPEETTANMIREAGMVALRSIGENKADIKVISEVLDQGQTQTLKQSILDSINQIVGLPYASSSGSESNAATGAVILKYGWSGAETRAQDFEQMFHEPEQRFLEIVCDITSRLSDFSLDPDDIDVKFTRRNYEDLLTKSQTLVTMLGNDKIHPQCAYEACGLFVDTQEAYNMGMDWYREHGETVVEEVAAQDKVAEE